jgi:hypothetical protein
MRITITIPCCLAVMIMGVALLSQPAEASVITPTAVTGAIAGDAGSHINFLIVDNGGFPAAALQRPLGTGVTLNTGDPLADALATVHERSGAAHAESWTRNTAAGNPVFSFDLGADTSVGSIILWQYGNGSPGNSARDFELIFHTAAEGNTFSFASGGGSEATEFSGQMDPAANYTTVDNVAQFFGFGSAENARYIGLRIASNYNGIETPGGDRYGLGEVRFATEVPEPATMFVMIAAGIPALLKRRRRRA